MKKGFVVYSVAQSKQKNTYSRIHYKTLCHLGATPDNNLILSDAVKISILIGAPCRTRTCNQRLRTTLLYPVELMVQIGNKLAISATALSRKTFGLTSRLMRSLSLLALASVRMSVRFPSFEGRHFATRHQTNKPYTIAVGAQLGTPDRKRNYNTIWPPNNSDQLLHLQPRL